MANFAKLTSLPAGSESTKIIQGLNRRLLDAYRIGLFVHLLPLLPAPLKPSLKQAQHARIPIPEYKQHQKRHCEKVLGCNRVVDRPRKVAPDCQLDPRDDAEPFAIHLRLGFFALL